MGPMGERAVEDCCASDCGTYWSRHAAVAGQEPAARMCMKKSSPTNESRSWTKRPARRKGDTGLSVSAQQFSEKAIRGLIDDWLVPSLLEQFLRGKMELSDSSQEDHN